MRRPRSSTLFPYTTLFRSVMFTDWGLHEVVQCKVEPYYWQLNNLFLANLDAWNELPEKDRTAVQEAVNEVTDRKSTRLNSSHVATSYAVFCLKRKKPITRT